MSRNKTADVTNTWFEYDWNFNNAEAVYCVNTEYSDKLDMLGRILVILECKTKRRELGDGEYNSYERLRDKLIRKLQITYVGLIECVGSVRFYFYARSTDIAVEIDKYIKHIANRVFCECKFDESKNFYLNTLLPDCAKRYTEENRSQLKLFSDNGDNMEAPRKLNFHLYFPSEPLQILFEEEARISGYAIGVREFVPEQDLPHGVVVHRMMALIKSDVDFTTTQVIRIAEKYEGTLGFWDCVLIPKRKSL